MNKQDYLKQIDTVIESGPYRDDWASLTAFTLPEWFREAKFGIFIHWGLYSVPAFNNEWYSRNMYIQGSPEYEHHLNTYGAHKDFGYKDFIPLFKAERFDGDEWAELFAKAGARYVVPVAEHHDGFQMYASEFSRWNAAQMGPKRDILGELKAAFERKGLVFATSSHRAEHLWFMGGGKQFDSDIKEPLAEGDFYWPSLAEQPEPHHDPKAAPYPTKAFLEDWLVRTCEIIDKYRPQVIYFDWWIQHEGYKGTLKKIAAYYYNRGEEWGQSVGICYKYDAFAFGAGIVDVERGKLATAKPYYWQTDTAVARNSWCYTTTLDYKSSREIICYLIDVVSKNGNLLLNIGPKADGTIPPPDRQLLLDIGRWLADNGEAVYGSKCWRYAEEGPTAEVEGHFSDGTGPSYTAADFRFTVGNGAIYAICLQWPEDGAVTVRSLGVAADPHSSSFRGLIQGVRILGFDGEVSYYADGDGLHVEAPGLKSDWPVSIKVTTD